MTEVWDELETWKDIYGFEGYYQVSNLGRVKSLQSGKWRNKERILKCSNHNMGYKNVILITPDKRENVLVHRLVAKTYISNPDNKLFVDHINNNPSDNRVINLRWANHKENLSNLKKPKSNTSGYKGVSLDKTKTKYKAYICHNYKKIYLGQYATAEEAYKAYCAKAKELFGEFYNPG